MKTISIGIPAYNAWGYLKDCLSSIERYLLNDILEVIIFDDGSTDNTANYIRDNYPWVKLIKSDINRGIGYGMQQIIDSYSGDFLFRLDSDTEITRNIIPELQQNIEKYPTAGAFALKLVDPAGKDHSAVEYKFKKPLTWFWDYFLWAKKLMKRIEVNYHTTPIEIAYSGTGAVVVRKEAIHQIGEFDTRMNFFMEDADWLWRINKAGWRILYLPTTSIIHHGGQSSFMGDNLYIHTRDFSIRNLYYFYQKHAPGELNRHQLTFAVLAGSLASLILALVVFPFSLLKPQIKQRCVTSIRSFTNVWRWHFRNKPRNVTQTI